MDWNWSATAGQILIGGFIGGISGGAAVSIAGLSGIVGGATGGLVNGAGITLQYFH